MIQKPSKKLLHPTSYRTLFLLNTLSKFLKTLLLNRLNTHIESKIFPKQHSFRPNHSTTTELLKLTDEIVININKNTKTAVVSLNIEKLFDKIWHSGLIYKFIYMKIQNWLTNILKSFLSDRSFQIKINDTLSTIRPINAGVPQCSCLSPHLFSIYINNMPEHTGFKIALFADDILMHATSNISNTAVLKLQKQIDLIEP